ncbi:MAG: RNA polymerase sigma factor [Gemmatimonadaceae bacterium]
MAFPLNPASVRAGRRVLPLMTDAGNDPDGTDAAAAAAGDAEAFARLHRRRSVQIHALARRFLGSDEADDATQDVFIRAWEKLPAFRGQASFRTWLHRLAVNVLLRRIEQLRRRAAGPMSQDVDGVATSEGGANAMLARIDVDAALATLPPELRQVVVLHDIEGCSHAEIAELLRISVGNSRIRLHRARLELRRYVMQRRAPSDD